ncbi:MAG: Npun_R2479 family HD domain-containing metalloprotein [Cyanobacteria bacterium P01_E01_bin.42]
MFSLIKIAIDTCIKHIQAGYYSTYGSLKPDYPEILAWATTMALENINRSDAAYHDVEHTALVVLTGQEILRGKQIRDGGVTPEDWLHCMLSLLCHDIGYIKGICAGDNIDEKIYIVDNNGGAIALSPGATDASLTPYHVDRGKLFVSERFGYHKLIDTGILQRNIELTRFPVPEGEEYKDTIDYPGLVRAADLIGQLADPRYLLKLPALYQEFEENGTNQQLGYAHPGELRAGFPAFFWNVVYPYIEDGLGYLNVTQAGRQIVANLYANVFVVERELKQAASRQAKRSQEVRLAQPQASRRKQNLAGNWGDRALAFHPG